MASERRPLVASLPDSMPRPCMCCVTLGINYPMAQRSLRDREAREVGLVLLSMTAITAAIFVFRRLCYGPDGLDPVLIVVLLISVLPLVPLCRAVVRDRRQIVGSSGKYHFLGTQWKCNGETCGGPVVIGQDAIYALAERRATAAGTIAMAIGAVTLGPGAALLVSRLTGEAAVSSAPQTCRFGDLPGDIREHPDWPVEYVKLNTPVLVLPKSCVAEIVHPKYSNEFHLICNNSRVRLIHFIGTNLVCTRRFQQLGWSIGAKHE